MTPAGAEQLRAELRRMLDDMIGRFVQSFLTEQLWLAFASVNDRMRYHAMRLGGTTFDAAIAVLHREA